MHVVLFVATARGLSFCKHFHAKYKDVNLTVVSFREDDNEPPFLNNIMEYCFYNGIVFFESKKMHVGDVAAYLEKCRPDVAFVVSWRYLMPDNIVTLFDRGVYVFHDSLLPRFRGFSPTPWAVILGEAETGATLFRINNEMDRGPIVSQKSVSISPDDYIDKVMSSVTEAYLDIIDDVYPDIALGRVKEFAQDESLATYTCKRSLSDARIDWARGTKEIYDLVRASSDPYPGARTVLNGEDLIIWKARVADQRNFVGRIPGRAVSISDDGVDILTGDGVLTVETVAKVGGVRCGARQLIRRLSDTLL